MEARFLKCAIATHWLPHTPVQIFFHLVLVHKKVWCSLSSLSIQIGVLAVTFYITLLSKKYFLGFLLLDSHKAYFGIHRDVYLTISL